MALDRITELLELMKKHDLTELELKEKGFSIRLVKGSGPAAPGPATVVVSGGAHHSPSPAARPARGEADGGAAAPASETLPEGIQEITSPIVGTFYRSPSPDAEVFVDVGSPVEAETTICIIEAMKVMNEVKAEVNGVIRACLVDNGQPVEFGQPIFQIEPVG